MGKKIKRPSHCAFSVPVLFGFSPFPPFPHRKTFCETTPEEKFDPIWPSKKSSTWGASPFALNFW